MKIKAKTFRMPNLDSENDGFEELEEEIEDYVKKQLEDDYSIISSIGGDSFIIIIFKQD